MIKCENTRILIDDFLYEFCSNHSLLSGGAGRGLLEGDIRTEDESTVTRIAVEVHTWHQTSLDVDLGVIATITSDDEQVRGRDIEAGF